MINSVFAYKQYIRYLYFILIYFLLVYCVWIHVVVAVLDVEVEVLAVMACVFVPVMESVDISRCAEIFSC